MRYLVLFIAWLFCSQVFASDILTRGKYIFHAAGCTACHTDTENKGPLLAGGRRFETPFGIFYSPNITPSKKYGIGNWSDDEFIRAMTLGQSPDGEHYYPVFPYTSYTRMTRQDLLDLKGYLFSLPAVEQASRPHELPWYVRRGFMWIWKMLFFTPGEAQNESHGELSTQWNRGSYLVNALGHCAECHSPRNRLGAIDSARRFAGSSQGPEGEAVPNITPHRKTGIGKWSKGELIDYLNSGETPDGDYAGGLMAEVIDAGLSHLSRQDLEAIVVYLQALPPVDNPVTDKP